MKTTSRILNTLLGLIFIAGTTFLLSNTVAYKKNSGNTGKDSTKIAAVTPNIQAVAVSLPVVEISSSQFEEPEYWVNYLNATIGPELEQTETNSGVLDEMENNPNWWIDYLNKEIH
ncbi:MAG: hypothetical protein AB9842_07565 [Bacteroidales bacterium]